MNDRWDFALDPVGEAWRISALRYGLTRGEAYRRLIPMLLGLTTSRRRSRRGP